MCRGTAQGRSNHIPSRSQQNENAFVYLTKLEIWTSRYCDRRDGSAVSGRRQDDVSAVCHSTSADLALTAGATQAYAYDRSEMPDANGQFDLVFDTAPSMSFSSASSYLQPRGTYVTTMPHLDAGDFIRSRFSRKKWGHLMESDTEVQRMERLRTLITEGAFRPVTDSVHPLAQASDAFDRKQERGRRGKILLDLTTGS